MIGISGIGLYKPTIMSICDVEPDKSEDELKKLGIDMVPIEDNLMATEMAIVASRRALENAGLDANDLDVIVDTQASMHDYLVWQVSAEIQSKLGAQNAYFFDLYQACSGFIMGLVVAKQFLKSDPSINRFLLCTSEKWSPSLETRTVGKLVFADGGAAAILEKDCVDNIILGHSFIGRGNLNDVSRMQVGAVSPPSQENPATDYFYRMTNMEKAVNEMIPININLFYKVGLDAILKSNLTLNDVNHLILPSVGFGLFEKIVNKFGIPIENTNYKYVAKSGDGSTIDALVSYKQMIDDKILKKKDNVLILGQGAGATWAAIVLKV
ncbi:3-oxoacyl-[acyl-carrier-protein] synthase III C-terminal domain-containing protein [Streptococcus mutans]|uniref:3-oxoacyl-[acyl-carrier-protein] synthase III C-terminal domain-containing protein n=1 Tax=Streptococcus mutans TaxID=1309 RepID=UPI000F6D8979|nr:3-oxoacyl-[acyl-carrier-protein] synthase III C-terminal domain-containing protein [Streptococcus mutans]MCB5050634.1 hypothetical protein [Streptococcus mutans]MCB5080071.1 hypothetical protein [Streptococcus mutans]MCY7117622.1 hypothetical protein [Streptococcus mutans]MCY7125217.1 hypothetical protein [Streptococcus mutans]NLQ33797.1 hypothetical protein [Streptococcus mutans]